MSDPLFCMDSIYVFNNKFAGKKEEEDHFKLLSFLPQARSHNDKMLMVGLAEATSNFLNNFRPTPSDDDIDNDNNDDHKKFVENFENDDENNDDENNWMEREEQAEHKKQSLIEKVADNQLHCMVSDLYIRTFYEPEPGYHMVLCVKCKQTLNHEYQTPMYMLLKKLLIGLYDTFALFHGPMDQIVMRSDGNPDELRHTLDLFLLKYTSSASWPLPFTSSSSSSLSSSSSASATTSGGGRSRFRQSFIGGSGGAADQHNGTSSSGGGNDADSAPYVPLSLFYALDGIRFLPVQNTFFLHLQSLMNCAMHSFNYPIVSSSLSLSSSSSSTGVVDGGSNAASNVPSNANALYDDSECNSILSYSNVTTPTSPMTPIPTTTDTTTNSNGNAMNDHANESANDNDNSNVDTIDDTTATKTENTTSEVTSNHVNKNNNDTTNTNDDDENGDDEEKAVASSSQNVSNGDKNEDLQKPSTNGNDSTAPHPQVRIPSGVMNQTTTTTSATATTREKVIQAALITYENYLTFTGNGLSHTHAKTISKYLPTLISERTKLIPPSIVAKQLATVSGKDEASSRQGIFLTGPTNIDFSKVYKGNGTEVTMSGDEQPRFAAPRLFLRLNGQIEKFHLIVYQFAKFHIALLVRPRALSDIEFYYSLKSLLDKKFKSLWSAFSKVSSGGDSSSSSSSSGSSNIGGTGTSIVSKVGAFDETYKYIYFNHSNLAMKSAGVYTNPKLSQEWNVVADMHRLFITSENKSNVSECFAKVKRDSWVVGKFFGQREFYLVFDQKNYSLVEINAQVHNVTNIFFSTSTSSASHASSAGTSGIHFD